MDLSWLGVPKKKCCKCQQFKELSSFNKLSSAKDGLMYRCKTCHKVYYKRKANKYKQGMKEYYKKNTEKHKARNKQWAKNNPEKVRKSHAKADHNRRAAKLNNGGIDRDIEIDIIYTYYKGKCGICSKFVEQKDKSIDHIRPLSKGGTHTWDNVQLAHLKCNIKKGNRV